MSPNAFVREDACELSVSDLRVWVHLGCTPEERYHSQLVRVDLTFFFSSPPEGMQTDQLKDTVCYLKVVECIQALVKEKHFSLIEHLTQSIYVEISQYLERSNLKDIKVKVRITKVAPPVPGVHGGVSFTYFD